jgi:hypothetical protein
MGDGTNYQGQIHGSFNKASTAQINLAPGQTISQVR